MSPKLFSFTVNHTWQGHTFCLANCSVLTLLRGQPFLHSLDALSSQVIRQLLLNLSLGDSPYICHLFAHEAIDLVAFCRLMPLDPQLLYHLEQS